MYLVSLVIFLLMVGCERPPAVQEVDSQYIRKLEELEVVASDSGPSETMPDAAGLPPADSAAVCGEVASGMVCIPGGWFVRGVDSDVHVCEQEQPNNDTLATRPAQKIWVDTFMMDITEVTVGAYKTCEKQKACDEAGPVYADYKHPKQPITGVSWYDAQKFCRAQGKRLPTEAEWELAARGYEGELNPWGNQAADCELAVIKDERGRSCGKIKRRGKSPDTGRVLFVDSRPPQRFGLIHMVGNAEEWVADWWSEGWEECGEPCQGKNPKGACGESEVCESTPYKVLRGGSWYWGPEHATGYHRRKALPGNKPFHHFGFRCAKGL